MRVTREQMQANRVRILEAASLLFREKGFDGVSVAQVMQAAGLTHGGFYGHFSSKDDLIAQTLDYIFRPGQVTASDLSAYIDAYLAPRHRDSLGQGCPTAALVADIPRQTPAARLAMTEGLRSQIKRIQAALPEAKSADAGDEAIGLWATMVGAMLLARAVDDPDFSDAILKGARAWIGERGAAGA